MMVSRTIKVLSELIQLENVRKQDFTIGSRSSFL